MPAASDWFRAACQRELERAHALLADPAADRNAAVHEGRKSLRRVRAWLRLLERSRREALHAVDQSIRSLRRTIGPLRDAASRIEALDRLRQRKALRPARTLLARARRQLAKDLAQRWAAKPIDGGAWTRLLGALAQLAAGVADWPLDGLSEAELGLGLRRAFLRACRERKLCAGRQAAVVRHAWRGKVRIVLLQGQLLASCGSVPGLDALKRLAQSLGNENDLAQVSRVLGRIGLSDATRLSMRRLVQQQRRLLAQRNDQRAESLLRPRLLPSWQLG